MEATKKITKATFKSFIKKNEGKLFTVRKTRFDGMTDSVENTGSEISPAVKTESHVDHTLGLAAVWLVGGGRDYFSHYEKNGFVGIEFYNSCGSGIVAVQA